MFPCYQVKGTARFSLNVGITGPNRIQRAIIGHISEYCSLTPVLHILSSYNWATDKCLIFTMEIQVSQLIVRFLQQLGIDTIFGMPGAHILLITAPFNSRLPVIFERQSVHYGRARVRILPITGNAMIPFLRRNSFM